MIKNLPLNLETIEIDLYGNKLQDNALNIL